LNYLPGLASNLYPPYLSLPSSIRHLMPNALLFICVFHYFTLIYIEMYSLKLCLN
jgi:hypothetical protein